MLDDDVPPATVVAIAETKVSILTRDEFQGRLEDMDPLLKAVYGVTVKRLRAVLQREKEDEPAPTLVSWKG
ncbi:MAG: hypothetical protein VW268_02230 [Rhodospirillaceae bacterium]